MLRNVKKGNLSQSNKFLILPSPHRPQPFEVGKVIWVHRSLPAAVEIFEA
jgi:hypothetical protein